MPAALRHVLADPLFQLPDHHYVESVGRLKVGPAAPQRFLLPGQQPSRLGRLATRWCAAAAVLWLHLTGACILMQASWVPASAVLEHQTHRARIRPCDAEQEVAGDQQVSSCFVVFKAKSAFVWQVQHCQPVAFR